MNQSTTPLLALISFVLAQSVTSSCSVDAKYHCNTILQKWFDIVMVCCVHVSSYFQVTPYCVNTGTMSGVGWNRIELRGVKVWY